MKKLRKKKRKEEKDEYFVYFGYFPIVSIYIQISPEQAINKISQGTKELETGGGRQREAEPCFGASGPLLGKGIPMTTVKMSRL